MGAERDVVATMREYLERKLMVNLKMAQRVDKDWLVSFLRQYLQTLEAK